MAGGRKTHAEAEGTGAVNPKNAAGAMPFGFGEKNGRGEERGIKKPRVGRNWRGGRWPIREKKTTRNFNFRGGLGDGNGDAFGTFLARKRCRATPQYALNPFKKPNRFGNMLFQGGGKPA